MGKWKPYEELERQKEIENQPPTTEEENKNHLGAELLGREENGGGQSQNQTQQETNDENSRNEATGRDGEREREREGERERGRSEK